MAQAGGHGSKRHKQSDAIAALLQAPSMQDAANLVGIGINTLVRWMTEPEFMAAYNAARRQVVMQAIARMQKLCSTAVQRLEETLESPDTAAAVRVQAIKLVFDIAIKGVELEEIITRLRRLEEHFLTQKGTP